MQLRCLGTSRCAAVRRSTTLVVECSSSSRSCDEPAQPTSRGSRRDVLAATIPALVGALLTPAPAQATSEFGQAIIDFWRSRQSQNGGAKLLAPIRGARIKLEEAQAMVEAMDRPQLQQVLALVRSSSMNCYLYEAAADAGTDERASLLTQSLKLADPCTFRLIVKNVTDFATEADKQRGRELVSELVLSYSLLDDFIDRTAQGEASVMPKMKEQLRATYQLVAQVETFVQGVLGV